MKKTKLIALTMAVAIMMMGAGYAIWSDQVFLTTKVSTGNFDMTIDKITTRTGDNEKQNEQHDPMWHSYDWTNLVRAEKLNANEAIVEFSDMYPGGVVQVDMTMVNNGSIPAVLKDVKVEYLSGNQELFNLLRAQTSWKADIDGDGDQDDWAHVEWNKDPWYKLPAALKALVANTKSNNLVIEPNGWFALGDGTEDGCIKFKLDPSAGNEFQKQAVRFKITFDWEQWASDPNANGYDNYGGDGEIPGIVGQDVKPQ
ncbi:hypothetical protein [Sedimentibacter sp. B4]|uniref:hypothetical protein n=1 Tax=Sedimentibacter sp. B4 TaxID=304766 RepID=UPI00031FCD7A|nr:hypothetical protein [Sedimentibacter sp. B4]